MGNGLKYNTMTVIVGMGGQNAVIVAMFTSCLAFSVFVFNVKDHLRANIQNVQRGEQEMKGAGEGRKQDYGTNGVTGSDEKGQGTL